MPQWASDLAALIERLGLDRPVILGQSFGGMVAQRFAIDHPRLASGIILLSTAARFDLEQGVANFAQRGGARLAELARAFFTAGPSDHCDALLREGLPHYAVGGKSVASPADFEPHVLDHFYSSRADAPSFDFRR